MNENWLIPVFWLLVGLLFYAYAGFPALVIAVGSLRRRTVRRRPETPAVTVIVAAFNEERDIQARIDNLLELDYPAQSLTLIIASDGSTDKTESIVSSFAERDDRVQLLRLPRRGKAFALASAAAAAKGEILVFSDANTLFRPDAVRNLVSLFGDPSIGGVAGNTVYDVKKTEDAGVQGEEAYWSYDKWLKRMESMTGSIVSAHGGIYAIRRELFPKTIDPSVTDDFAISTEVVARGYRLVFDPDAIAFEPVAPRADLEFRRKVRLMTRGLRGVVRRRALLNPFCYGFYSVVLFSHKVLRRLVPVFLLLLLVTSLALSWNGTLQRAGLALQLTFYGLALLGMLLRFRHIGRSKLLYVPFFFCMANAAALVALLKLLRGEKISFWQTHHG